MPLIASAMIGTTVLGGVLGAEEGRKGRRASRQASERALQQFQGIDIPDSEKMKLYLEGLQQVGEYDPILEEYIALQPSAMEEIQVDPRLAESQIDVLSALEQIVGQGGMTDADLAALEMTRRNVAQEEAARQNAIMQNLQQRGIAGSGSELATRLMSSQASADRNLQQDLQTQQIAQQRALQALAQQGQLATQLRQQQFGEQTDVASARDVVNRMNLQNQMQTQRQNVSARNQAQLQNLAERQRIADANVGVRNEQQALNKRLAQQEFENKMRLASGKASAYGAQAQQATQNAAQQTGMISDITKGVTTGIAALK